MAVGVLDPRKGIVWQDSGSSLTPEQIEQLQALEIRKRMGGVDTSPVNHWTQGAARVVDALGGVLRERRLNNAASENQSYNQELASPLIDALSGASTSSPMASASTSGVAQEMASTSPAPNVAPEIASGIVETASALGIDPVDLGTAISYETAGTFDPTKAGPTTQWGQHKGLIQFGEPQAKQYGVDWNNPVGSQLGPNGAVANYLRSTGVKPGMGMMDIYSAINAGRVGRYGASDATNGGAPGTVADKVNQQMAGHRAKAMALLGTQQQSGQAAIEQVAPSSYVEPMVRAQPQAMSAQAGFDAGRFGEAQASPMMASPEVYSAQADFAPELPAPVNVGPAPAVAAVQQPQMAPQPQAPATNTAAIAQALRVMSDPRANEGTRRVAQVLIQQEQQKQAAAQEQSVWQQRQQYEQQQQNSDPLRQLQIQEAQIKLQQMQDPNSSVPDAVRSLDIRAQRAGLQQGTPEYNNFFITQGVRPPSNVGAPPAGYKIDYDANNNPVSMSPIAGSPAAVAEETRARALSNQQGGKETITGVITDAATKARQAVDTSTLPATGTIGGLLSGIGETGAAEVKRQVDVLKSNATIENLNAMRASSPTGAALGAVSDRENAMLAAKVGALDPSSPRFKSDLEDYERTMLKTIHGPDAGEKIFNQTRRSQKPISEMTDAELEALANGD